MEQRTFSGRAKKLAMNVARTAGLLAVALLVFLSRGTIVARAEVLTVKCNGTLQYTMDLSTGEVVFSGEGTWGSGYGFCFLGSGRDASERRDILRSVRFENCKINGSMSYFFKSTTSETESLISIDFSGLDTSGVTDMREMFYGCKKLKSLDLGNLDTSNVTNMNSMFYNCSELKSLNLSKFNTGKVTNMSWMFEGCSSLTDLDVSRFNTSSVTNMQRMFGNCSGLTGLDVSRFNTSSLTAMSGMFYGCSGLTKLDVSGFNTSAVKDMTGIFNGCSGLTSLNVSGFNTSAATEMNAMFANCSGLTDLNVSSFKTSTVTDMTAMFYGCSGLTNLNLGNFDTINVLGMARMFYNCSSLKSLDLSNFETWKLKSCYEMFSGCKNLSDLNLSNFDLGNTSLSLYGCSKLVRIRTPKAIGSEIYLPYPFYTSSGLEIYSITEDFLSTTLTRTLVNSIKLEQSELAIEKGKSATIAVIVSPSNASKKDVQWKSDKTSVATVDKDGKITAKAVGTATITATARDGSDVSASCTVTVKIGVAGIALNRSELILTEGDITKLTATVKPSNATDQEVDWSSSDTSVATVDDEGNVTAKYAGTATITVKAKDGSGVSASCAVTVKTAEVKVFSISLDKYSLDLTVGDTASLTAKVRPSNATNQNIEWRSDRMSVAYVDDSGNVTARSAGTATITAKATDGSGEYASCTVTVKAAEIKASSVSLDKSSLSLAVGDTASLKASITPYSATNKSVTWSSSNTSVAVVDSSGNVTAKSAGTVTITATAADGSGKSASCTVTVKAAEIPPTEVKVTAVNLDKSTLSLTAGDMATLTASITPSNATNKSVTWSSGNTSVATVSSSGTVTARSAGTATITATAADGSGRSASCTVTVKAAEILPTEVKVTAVNLDKSTLSLTAGDMATLTASITPSNATNKSVTWSSSDVSVATVDNSGSVTAKSPGTATITATAADGSRKSASCTVTVTAPQTVIGEQIVYRLYNDSNHEHLYTTDVNEVRVLATTGGWTYEGSAWVAPQTGLAVYRLYCSVTRAHLYTSDMNEVTILSASPDWTMDNGGNPMFYTGDADAQDQIPIYRLYNEQERMHLLTTDLNEYNVLGGLGWNQEGVKLNCLATGNNQYPFP